MNKAGPAVGIIMGSQSDWQTMQHAAATLERLGVALLDRQSKPLKNSSRPDTLTCVSRSNTNCCCGSRIVRLSFSSGS